MDGQWHGPGWTTRVRYAGSVVQHGDLDAGFVHHAAPVDCILEPTDRDSDRPDRRRVRSWLVVVVAAAALAGIGGAVNLGRDPSADLAADDSPAPSEGGEAIEMEPDGLNPPVGSAEATFEEDGWIRMGPSAASPEYEVPRELWVAWVEGPGSVGGRLPLHSEPSEDAPVVGYYYSGVGYVPADVADTGQFDADQARADRWPCDPRADLECRDAVRRGDFLQE